MNPCFECSKRHEACHSSCKDYAEYRKRLDQQNSKRSWELASFWVSRKLRFEKIGQRYQKSRH